MQLSNPDLFFWGLIIEFGYDNFEIEFTQPARERVFSSYNLFPSTNYGIVGLFSQTQLPLRLATIAGFFLSVISFTIALWFLIYKQIF